MSQNQDRINNEAFLKLFIALTNDRIIFVITGDDDINYDLTYNEKHKIIYNILHMKNVILSENWVCIDGFYIDVENGMGKKIFTFQICDDYKKYSPSYEEMDAEYMDKVFLLDDKEDE